MSGLDPSDPLNLLLHNHSQYDGTDTDTDLASIPFDWNTLSSMLPPVDNPNIEFAMDFGLMGMSFDSNVGIELNALNYAYPALDPLQLTSEPPHISSHSSSRGDSTSGFFPPHSPPASEFEEDPATELASRVRNAAGVVRAVRINQDQQQQQHQQELHQQQQPPQQAPWYTPPPPAFLTTPVPAPVLSNAPIAAASPSCPKTNHSIIERRYRTNLNARIQSLRQAVPALRVVDRAAAMKAGETGEDDGPEDIVDSRGFVDGVKVARKCSKTNVIGKAVEYIRVLKKREARLARELTGVKTLLGGLVGGRELLHEWEREWAARFGGPETDEASEGGTGAADKDAEEGEEESDEDGTSVGRKRKKPKVDPAAAKPKPKAAAAAAAAPTPTPADGEKKRGRPRKVMPLPASALASPLSMSVPMQEAAPQQRQYLLGVFALFSFFANANVSGSPAHRAHEGHVLTRVVPVRIEDTIGLLQAFHLLVSAAMFASVLLPIGKSVYSHLRRGASAVVVTIPERQAAPPPTPTSGDDDDTELLLSSISGDVADALKKGKELLLSSISSNAADALKKGKELLLSSISGDAVDALKKRRRPRKVVPLYTSALAPALSTLVRMQEVELPYLIGVLALFSFFANAAHHTHEGHVLTRVVPVRIEDAVWYLDAFLLFLLLFYLLVTTAMAAAMPQASRSSSHPPLILPSLPCHEARLCTRYCLVCHNKLTADFQALKPYVCDRPLCTYQYYAHNLGASLEYEIIHNLETVDLLVSLCYSAAAEGVLDEPLPRSMGLRVPPPDKARITTTPVNNYQMYQNPGAANAAATVPAANYQVGLDGLVEFHQLPVEHMRVSIAGLVDTLPSVDDMKHHLERKAKPRLKEMENGSIVHAARSVLRWCVTSCTAYLEEMSDAQCIQGVDSAWRQFRFSVGAPDAEVTSQNALQNATTTTDANAKKYPSLYVRAPLLAFLISVDQLRCRRSTGRRSGPVTRYIIRHGLRYQTVASGRAFGDGVYLAKRRRRRWGTMLRAVWRAQKSKLGSTSCVALAEVVNLPKQFVSSYPPHFVVRDTEWIMCRYLLIKGLEAPAMDASKGKKKSVVPLVKLDPAQTITLMRKALQVLRPGYRIGELMQQRRQELVEEEYDETEAFIFEERKQAPAAAEVIDISDDEPIPPPPPSKGKGKGSSFIATVSSALKGKGSSSAAGGSSSAPPKGPPKDDWKLNADYVRRTIELLMPPPFESSPSATIAVQRELKTMLTAHDKAMTSPGGQKELGWYVLQEFMGDNLFQWIVEMHSFDETLPIAKDLKRENVDSSILEIRFRPPIPLGRRSLESSPLASCPSYRAEAVTSRAEGPFACPYSISESLVGFKRASATHGWTVPEGLYKLVR
ncbi:hypothetical protein B0H14DRAFT_3468718 [Mycena olivaceomarginata]|nr:hypothetical protein B0H14DRAFT_3468718 [Mycena olivaceomarginata]